jgi:hypothetical protein
MSMDKLGVTENDIAAMFKGEQPIKNADGSIVPDKDAVGEDFMSKLAGDAKARIIKTGRSVGKSATGTGKATS